MSAYHINVILVSFKSYWSFTLWSTYSFIIALTNMTSIDHFPMVNYLGRDKRSINFKAFLHLPISMGIFLSVTQASYCFVLYPFSVNIQRLHQQYDIFGFSKLNTSYLTDSYIFFTLKMGTDSIWRVKMMHESVKEEVLSTIWRASWRAT